MNRFPEDGIRTCLARRENKVSKIIVLTTVNSHFKKKKQESIEGLRYCSHWLGYGCEICMVVSVSVSVWSVVATGHCHPYEAYVRQAKKKTNQASLILKAQTRSKLPASSLAHRLWSAVPATPSPMATIFGLRQDFHSVQPAFLTGRDPLL